MADGAVAVVVYNRCAVGKLRFLQAHALATGAKAEEPKAAPDGYICPITGERLGCPGCCPLNQKK